LTLIECSYEIQSSTHRIDCAPILFPKYTWSFYRSCKAPLKHPTRLPFVTLRNCRLIPLLLLGPCNPYSSMAPTCNPCFVTPKDLEPINPGEVEVGLGKGETLFLYFSSVRGSNTRNTSRITLLLESRCECLNSVWYSEI
jgi:hypothetical protein